MDLAVQTVALVVVFVLGGGARVVLGIEQKHVPSHEGADERRGPKPRARVPTPPATLSKASGFRARVALSVASLSEGREEVGPGGPSYASTSYSESLSEDCSRHASWFGSDAVGGVIASRSLTLPSSDAAAKAFAAVIRVRGDPSGAVLPPYDTRGIPHARAREPRRRRTLKTRVGSSSLSPSEALRSGRVMRSLVAWYVVSGYCK